jgi:uncharacterized phage protein gp47/JayE
MSYAPPSVGPAGLTIASYPDIMDDNLQGFLNIYGQNQFVDPSSAIYQLLSIISLKQADCNTGLQLAYNQSSPLYAVGAGLDRLCKLVGIARRPATFSTASLTVGGTPGTTITAGVAEDVNGYYWNLPTTVYIPIGGSVNVSATCTTPGVVVAEAGQINIISQTDTAGWLTVTNVSPSTPGVAVESDSELRARFAESVAVPSATLLAGTRSDLLALADVERVNVLENPTSTTDSYGNGPHSLTCVVQGGTAPEIAQVIYDNRGIGCDTQAAMGNFTTTATFGSGASSITVASGTGVLVGQIISDSTNSAAIAPGTTVTTAYAGGTTVPISVPTLAASGAGDTMAFTLMVSTPVSDPNMGGQVTDIGYVPAVPIPVYVTMTVHGLAGFTTATLAAIQTAVVAYLNALSIGEPVVYSELYGAALMARSNPDVPIFSIRSVVSGLAAGPSGTTDIALAFYQVSEATTSTVVVTAV